MNSETLARGNSLLAWSVSPSIDPVVVHRGRPGLRDTSTSAFEGGAHAWAVLRGACTPADEAMNFCKSPVNPCILTPQF